jgi:hypothetical protein
MPQYTGIFDQQGRMRPSYFVFHWLSLLGGNPVKVSGTNKEIKTMASEKNNRINMLLWNFPENGSGKDYNLSLNLPSGTSGTFRVVKLDPASAVNNIKVLRSGSVKDMEKSPMNITLAPYEINWIEISR